MCTKISPILWNMPIFKRQTRNWYEFIVRYAWNGTQTFTAKQPSDSSRNGPCALNSPTNGNKIAIENEEGTRNWRAIRIFICSFNRTGPVCSAGAHHKHGTPLNVKRLHRFHIRTILRELYIPSAFKECWIVGVKWTISIYDILSISLSVRRTLL